MGGTASIIFLSRIVSEGCCLCSPSSVPQYQTSLSCVELSLGLNHGSLWLSALGYVPKTRPSLIKYGLSILLPSIVITDPAGS